MIRHSSLVRGCCAERKATETSVDSSPADVLVVDDNEDDKEEEEEDEDEDEDEDQEEAAAEDETCKRTSI